MRVRATMYRVHVYTHFYRYMCICIFSKRARMYHVHVYTLYIREYML